MCKIFNFWRGVVVFVLRVILILETRTLDYVPIEESKIEIKVVTVQGHDEVIFRYAAVLQCNRILQELC